MSTIPSDIDTYLDDQTKKYQTIRNVYDSSVAEQTAKKREENIVKDALATQITYNEKCIRENNRSNNNAALLKRQSYYTVQANERVQSYTWYAMIVYGIVGIIVLVLFLNSKFTSVLRFVGVLVGILLYPFLVYYITSKIYALHTYYTQQGLLYQYKTI